MSKIGRFMKMKIANVDLQDNEINLYKALRSTLLACRLAGLLPLAGLTQENSDQVSFSWISPYSLVYYPCVGGLLFLVIMSGKMLILGMEFRRFATFFFYTTCLISVSLVLRLAKRWKSIMEQVRAAEGPLTSARFSKSVVSKCDFIVIGVMLLAAVEHTMYILYSIQQTKEIYGDVAVNMHMYYNNTTFWVYNYVPYNDYFAVLIQLVTTQATFIWNFIDVLIMVFSFYLGARFEDFNEIISQNEYKIYINGGKSWSELQMQYTKLVQLVKIVNNELSVLVFMSFAINLFYVCQQLFYMINGELAAKAYVWYSFLFLLGRTLMVSLLAARMHTLSREPLNTLHKLPSSAYTMDTQKLMDQVHFSNVALTGFDFFDITRSMILTVAATIVTYELVLLQFEGNKPAIIR